MKKHLLILFFLLAFRLQATPVESTEPVGQRFGMSLLEVLDSIYKEGLYHYAGSSGKPSTPNGNVTVQFEDNHNGRLLTYGFVQDKCELAMMVMSISELDALVQEYDSKFVILGKQMWHTPYGRIQVTLRTGTESMRKDHKPHLLVIFDPSL